MNEENSRHHRPMQTVTHPLLRLRPFVPYIVILVKCRILFIDGISHTLGMALYITTATLVSALPVVSSPISHVYYLLLFTMNASLNKT